MKRCLKLSIFVIAILFAASALWLSHSVIAAEPATANPTPSSGDGTLFTAFAPVLKHPRCMNCHSQGDFPRQGR